MTRHQEWLVRWSAVALLAGATQWPALAYADSNQYGDEREPVYHLGFENHRDDSVPNLGSRGESASLVLDGVSGKAILVGGEANQGYAIIEGASDSIHRTDKDFSIEFWVRTNVSSDQQFVLLSNKRLIDNSLKSQKQKGWTFYLSNGTWAWNVGSGNRRLTYERDNGQHMSVNDGRWHQLVMTFDHEHSIARLYFDGVNRVTYNLGDKDEFDFASDSPLAIGWSGEADTSDSTLPAIARGARDLQEMVDRFNSLGIGQLESAELIDLVVDPEDLIRKHITDNNLESDIVSDEAFDAISRMRRGLSANPYTVHQVADFMQVAPLLKVYRLNAGVIEVDDKAARRFAAMERLNHPSFAIDELSIWEHKLEPEEILDRYTRHYQSTVSPLATSRNTLTAAAFNIHHGGKHETVEEDGWDSRETIAELIRRENIDVVMMQETYSSGDFISAELGYYFATTVDWDYLNQGANISVLSRYPIKQIAVPPNSSFMNVAALVAVSETQDVWVMSNWYGMNNFPDVYDFHEERFQDSDNTPVIFAGDFNAVPHTDGGSSPASKKLLETGFRDAYREKHPDVKEHSGHTHRGGRRIDQLYYKGSGLENESTIVISSWPSKFPSDHYLIKTIFTLDYSTLRED